MRMTAREKIAKCPPGGVHVLDPVKAAKMKGATMLIPSPEQMQEVFNDIPTGGTMDIKEFRADIAARAGADIVCPMVTGILWRVIAEASDEEIVDGNPPYAAWWRVTVDGKGNPRLPGGVARHRSLLLEEGVELKAPKVKIQAANN